MNLLIIDDERDAIETVQKHLRWEMLGFKQVFTALNKAQAKQQILNNDIDVMLCDIEMPLGSGLSLLEWVNDNEIDVCCVFMTCHAEFSYAQKAIQLGSFDYVLKPLDFRKLEETLATAVLKCKENKRMKQINSYWLDNRGSAIKEFWRNFFVGDIAPNLESIRYYWQQKHIDYSVEGGFLPILISVKQWNNVVSREDKKLYFYALRNIADEIFECTGFSREVLPFSNNMVLVILRPEETGEGEELEALLRKKCEAYIRVAKRYLPLSVCCYIGETMGICDIPGQLERLQIIDFNSVILSRDIIFLKNSITDYNKYRNTSYSVWLEYAHSRQYSALRREIKSTVEKAIEKDKHSRPFLDTLNRDFMFLLFDFARNHNIFMEELFSSPEADRFANNARQSLDNFELWVDYAVNKMESYEKKDNSSLDPVEKSKIYIKNNLSEDLSVEDIAASVHLNADYLNRIFKRQEGNSLSKYVINKKVEKAQQLMRETQTSIGEIAGMVGYYNYSSFNRVFSKVSGMSPQEYKNTVSNKNNV